MHCFVLSLLLGSIAAAPTLAGTPADTSLRVENAWIREAPPSVDVMGGYARLCNDADEAITLTQLSSDVFGEIQMHISREVDGQATMERLQTVEIGPHDCVDFAPGGRHLMLFEPTHAMRAGDRAVLTLGFANGKHMDVEFSVRRMGGMHEHHQ